jgi:hypothetical protein
MLARRGTGGATGAVPSRDNVAAVPAEPAHGAGWRQSVSLPVINSPEAPSQ